MTQRGLALLAAGAIGAASATGALGAAVHATADHAAGKPAAEKQAAGNAAAGKDKAEKDKAEKDKAEKAGKKAEATLRSATGATVGRVEFRRRGDGTEVMVTLKLPAGQTALDAFHGFHVHANNDPANGQGCVADPTQPSSTWFVSADGHLSSAGQMHGMHTGDLPSVLVNADGTATLDFTDQRLDVNDLAGRAVVLHAGPDNFGNVPTGQATDQYQPNTSAATMKTMNTGNSGDRIACGVINAR